MSQTVVEIPKSKEEQTTSEKLAEKLFKKLPKLTFDYRHSIAHVSPMLQKSMNTAYNKGLNDAIHFLLKEQDKKTNEETED